MEKPQDTGLRKTPFEMVKEFHETYGVLVADEVDPTCDEKLLRLRQELIQEEYHELMDALMDHNLVEIADAMADLVYVIYGTAVSYGIPLDECLEEVHRSNMSKLGADGKPIYREDGKVLKGPNWTPPDLGPLVFRT